nr:MAG TPA: hypothetical protein [Caudoviricetes sp.]
MRYLSVVSFHPEHPNVKEGVVKTKFENLRSRKMRPTDQPSNHANLFKTDKSL